MSHSYTYNISAQTCIITVIKNLLQRLGFQLFQILSLLKFYNNTGIPRHL